MLERQELLDTHAKTPAADRAHLRGLAQAALKSEHVTSDPAWDTYLSYIARALEVAQQQRTANLAALANPAIVDPAKIATARNNVFLMDERISSLTWAISMPAEIKRVGSVAKEKLAQMEAEDPVAEAAE